MLLSSENLEPELEPDTSGIETGNSSANVPKFKKTRSGAIAKLMVGIWNTILKLPHSIVGAQYLGLSKLILHLNGNCLDKT